MYSLRRDKKDEEDGNWCKVRFIRPRTYEQNCDSRYKFSMFDKVELIELRSAGNPFFNLDKTSVLQEARTFNETPVNARKCCHILTKILYLLNQGEYLGTTEATEAFFAMTKLFQSKDVVLRRLVYLGIKDLSNVAQDVIIVTSSLTKDMTGKEDMYRAAAIRALCKITDSTMLQAIERYMKQAIVDKGHAVSSAALVSSLHLSHTSHDVVKRWVNEAQEAINSDNIMVQYHALGLLYHIRKNDRLAVSKLVTKFTRTSLGLLKSPYAVCMLIRICCKLIDEEDTGTDSPLFDFIESCLRHKSEMVIFESAHAIINLKQTTSKDLIPAVSVLQLFCSSPKPTLRFAAVRTLNKVAMTHPAAVTACNLDLENLITDVNRSIATLAITTLLKTGSESSVDRLMKQISSFMSEISDEFKIVVVNAIRALCHKFPRKHSVMMNFLSSMLRDEGGFEYKKAIVDTIISIIEDNPEAKEAGLSHLCEFIEDCEHTILAVRILHLLGREGPRTIKPTKYIRFIYNRVILENAAVRAAAVNALAKFGAHVKELLPNILVLLQRCMLDSDDEVRDRSTYYHNILDQGQKLLNSQYILNSLQVSIIGLEKALYAYTMDPSDIPFDMKSVPLATQPITAEDRAPRKGKQSGMIVVKKVYEALVTFATTCSMITLQHSVSLDTIISKPVEKVAASRQDIFSEQLSAIPEFADLGPLFKSSLPVELTESETEYVVQCIKHVFPNHIVFQFDCTNTLNDQILENVHISMECPEEYEVISTVKCPKLGFNQNGTSYTCVAIPSDPTAIAGTFTNSLKYIVKDCDPATGEPDNDEGYEDEYVLEDIEVTVADNVMRFLGMQPCERSDKVPQGKSSHVLVLSGMYRGGHESLVRARLAFNDANGVTMNLAVRSTDAFASEVIASAVG
ncbi:Coatomer subunit gamma-2 [Nymphon striatum]|nr:Coatomer subunit gamma-2 [Nymphon striatum]